MIRTVPHRTAPLRRFVRPQTRRTERRRTIAVLDALWREVIYARDRKTCQMPLCGKTRHIQAHHIFSKKGRFLTRWDEDNGICLCAAHHIWGAHDHPLRFYEFIRKRLGDERFNRILMRSEQSAKGQDLEAVRLYLKQQLKELGDS